MKEYKYKQYKINVPLNENYSNLIEALDTYSTHMRNKIILETLQDKLVRSVQPIQNENADAANYEPGIEQQYNNEKIMKMLENLTKKVQMLENSGKADKKKQPEPEQVTHEAEEKEETEETATPDIIPDTSDAAPEVPAEVLDFLKALG